MESTTQTSAAARSRVDQTRASGGGRRLFLGLAVAFIAVLGVWIWGIRRADELPDLGEPFDVVTALRPIAIDDAENAFVGYAEAKALQLKMPANMSKLDYQTQTWTKASDEVREFVKKSRPALEKWREASERPDALYHQPGELAVDTLLPVVQDMAQLTRLAALEGSRHEEMGAMDQAWLWYRAMLRTSRHLGRRGVIIERLMGSHQYNLAAHRIVHWAGDARVDAKMLSLALEDVLAADAMTPPLSENLKLEYALYLRDINELRVMVEDVPMPGGRFGWVEQMVKATGAKPQIQRIRLRATNDVERSRRAARLLFANWLAQVDKPASKRRAIAIAKPLPIYEFEPSSSAAVHGVDAQALDQALTHTALAQQMFRDDDPTGGGYTKAPWEGDGPLAREPKRRAILIIKLAAELYRREKGQPLATAGSLLGTYLKALPEGIVPDDPIPAGLD